VSAGVEFAVDDLILPARLCLTVCSIKSTFNGGHASSSLGMKAFFTLSGDEG
jgi:hypothetical protein